MFQKFYCVLLHIIFRKNLFVPFYLAEFKLIMRVYVM